MKLNPQQEKAVLHLHSPLLVLAGAGSGKTRVITQKIAHLVKRFAPQNIFALTFTNKAAEEMKTRLKKTLGKEAEDLPISTFHSLGVRILREDGKHLGYQARFSIFDSKDSFDLLKDLAPRFKTEELYALQNKISHWKNNQLSPFDVSPENDFEKKALPLFNAYQKALKAYQAVDFDDLITESLKLFQNFPAVLEKWQNRARYVLIDEYQDTNRAQYALFRCWVEKNASFTVVGDNDQSIYAWRGADIENLKRLTVDFPKTQCIKLEQNYRSTESILNAANWLIQHNPNDAFFNKKLYSHLGKGEAVALNQFKNAENEAKSIALNLWAHQKQHSRPFGDYAILYRSNHLARPFEEALRSLKIPYVISGGQSFFDKTEIKDLSLYLRLFLNPKDDPAFIRAANTPARGLGSATLKILGEKAYQQNLSFFETLTHLLNAPLSLNNDAAFPKKTAESLRQFWALIKEFSKRAEKESPSPLLAELLNRIHYESWLKSRDEKKSTERFQNLLEFIGWLNEKSKGKSLNETAHNLALFSAAEKPQNENAVRLSTIHAAKGLEFPVVYLVGAEEGILPHRDSEIEEERRLMYVAITRAKEKLSVSFCNLPSSFIEEMHLTFNDEKADKNTALFYLKTIQEQLSI